MNTHKTLDAALVIGLTNDKAKSCAKILHRTEGECYINLTIDHESFVSALKRTPSADIKWIIGPAADYRDERRVAAAAALAAAVPGVPEMRALAEKSAAESDRYSTEFAAMMDDEQNDGARPPRPEDRSLAAQISALREANPRAALYLRAERQAVGTSSYSATSGEMKGGQDAKAILLGGGTIEEAEKALAYRYESNDWSN